MAAEPAGLRPVQVAWLSAMSLIGFLFGPALSAVAQWIEPWVTGAMAQRSFGWLTLQKGQPPDWRLELL